MEDIQPEIKAWPKIRAVAGFLTDQIHTVPIDATSDHYKPVEVVQLELPFETTHQEYWKNDYYQHTSERVSFYIPVPEVV